MNHFTTYSGIEIDVGGPPFNADMVSIIDIAHSLSSICRFGGHCRHFYSVAEHSVHMYHRTENEMAGLLHDSAEAYIGDVVAPLKRLLPAIRLYEKNILKVLEVVFGVQLTPMLPDVSDCDKVMLYTEYDRMMEGDVYSQGTKWDEHTFYYWTPEQAKIEFLTRYKELGGNAFIN